MLLPMLIAEHVDADARDYLEGVALRGGVAIVPLVDAPTSAGDHTLAIHVAGELRPSLFIARPAGPEGPSGQPLQLRPFARESIGAAAEAAEEAKSERDTGVQLKVSLGELMGRSLAGGKLRVDFALGAGGGGGAVYRAAHRDLRRDVAVKLLKRDPAQGPGFSERFQAEALAASRLDHPNLVRIHDVGEEPDGLLYISMEYLQGISLDALIKRTRALSLQRAAEIMLQLCAGLWHAHSRGVIHRDVKPTNVMLVTGHDDDGRPVEIVKLCDFGIALMDTSFGERRAAGTPEYMSPEQCRGAPLDGRSDVYSSGVMLYEMVTGRRPFEGQSTEDLARQHLLARPPPPSRFMPSLDAGMERIILRALEKDPDARHGSARELRQALADLLAGRSLIPEVERPPPMRAPASSMPMVPVRDAAAPSPAPASSQPAAEWLEDARAGFDAFFAQSGHAEASAYHDGDALARELTAAPARKLQEIAATRGGSEFAHHTAALEVAVKALARRGDVTALSEMVRVMAMVYSEDKARPQPTGAGDRALRVMHAIVEPVSLGLLADKVLADAQIPWEMASALFTWAQLAGAEALHGSRCRLRGQAGRSRFVTLMRSVGEHATPVLQEALGRLLPDGEVSLSDHELACDLLRAVPALRGVGMGVVAARYARGKDASVRAAALAVLAASWGERAVPELRHALLDAADEVRTSAIVGLGELRAVDDAIVAALAVYLEPSTVASDELRVAAADALAWSSPEARPNARRLVQNALGRGDDVLTVVRGRKPGPSFVLALARTLLAIGGPDAASRIRTRAAKAAEPLRAQLLTLAEQAR